MRIALIVKYYRLCIKPVLHKHRKLIERRGSLYEHIRLSIIFAEIAANPYVKSTYERLVMR